MSAITNLLTFNIGKDEKGNIVPRGAGFLDHIPSDVLIHIFSFIQLDKKNSAQYFLICIRITAIAARAIDVSIDNQAWLKWACKKDNVLVVNRLLKDPRVVPSANNNTAIRWASGHGHVEVVKELLKDQRVDPSANNNDAIRWASENGRIEVVKELLKDERVDPSANINLAIRLASQEGHVEIVRELLKDERVDPSALNNYAIKWAISSRHVEVVRELLSDPRVDPSVRNNEAIKSASRNGCIEVIGALADDPRVDLELGFQNIDHDPTGEMKKFFETKIAERKAKLINTQSSEIRICSTIQFFFQSIWNLIKKLFCYYSTS